MIDPSKVTNFNRTDAELEEFLLFCVCVAGKRATIQAQKLEQLLGLHKAQSPFHTLLAQVHAPGGLGKTLRVVKMGQYNRLEKTLCRVILYVDPRHVDLKSLEVLVGPKTARFFLLHTRPNQRIAVLDTHMLKFLKSIGVPNVPKQTPGTPKQYLRLENAYLDYLDKQGIKSVADHDLGVWNAAQKKRKTNGK